MLSNKKNVFYALIALTSVGLLFFSVKLTFKSLSSGDFSFFSEKALAENLSSDNLFATAVKNLSSDSPEMILVQSNSIVGICSPMTIDPKVLGSVLEEEEPEQQSEGGIIEYTVLSDDTLSSVAKKFNISTDTITWANNLSSKTLKPGQVLVILPVSGVMHLVKDGDTIGNIAKKYKATGGDTIAFNELKGENDIYIGDILIVPGGKKPQTVVSPRHVAGIPLATSYFIIPVEGKISQGLHGALYNAIDIATSCGKPIVVAAGGTVQRSGWIATGGNIVTILHPNGVVTYYGHMSTIIARSGQKVNAGDIVGYVGKTGYATGCHVHFEVRGATNFLSAYKIGAYVSWK